MSGRYRAPRLQPVPKDQIIKKWKFWKGDKVQMIQGHFSNKGKIGTVIRVFKKTNRLLVNGLNMYENPRCEKGISISKKHPKLYPRTIHYSDLALIDPKDGKPTKISWKKSDGKWFRVSKRTNTIVPFPEIPKFKRSEEIGEKDTLPEDVLTLSFDISTLNPLLEASRNYMTRELNIPIIGSDEYTWKWKGNDDQSEMKL